jgi:hypothetical protein
MNNRNPFIPNIPTAQGNWGDPHQIYTQHQNFINVNAVNNSILNNGGSNNNSNNNNNNNNNHSNGQMQIPFSAHQQVQQQLQQSHQWYTTQASSLPLTTLPLQGSTSGSIFWDDGPSVNLNPSGMQVSYATAYQNVNSGYQQQQQQHQQISNQSTGTVVHQIVSQNQRVAVPLTLDASHFVHFPVNLSPPAGMVSLPLSLNSRSTSNNSSSSNSTMSAHSPAPSRNSNNMMSDQPLSLSSRNTSTPMSVHSPSPTSMMEPLQLNIRSNVGSSPSINSHSRSPVSSVSHSHFSNNNSNNNQNNMSRGSQQNARSSSSSQISMNQFNSHSPSHNVNSSNSRNSRSPAAFSGNSPSHSPSPMHLNSRGSSVSPQVSSSSSGGVHHHQNNLLSSSSSSNNFNKSQSSSTSSSGSSGFSLNPPSYTPGFPSSLNARFSPAAVQFLTSAAAATMNLTEATLRQQLAMNAAASLTATQNFISANNNLRLQQQQQQVQQQLQQHHQSAPMAHNNNRSSVPVTALPFHIRSPSPPSASPSPPPPPPKPQPPKRKRGPAKKREPKKPVPINPTESMKQNYLSSFQPQIHSQLPLHRPSVISSVSQQSINSPSHQTAPVTSNSPSTSVSNTWNSNQSVNIPLPTMNPFPLVPTPMSNMTRMSAPIPYGNRQSTPPKSSSNNPSNLTSPTSINSSRMGGGPMFSSTAAPSPLKNSSPTKLNNSRFTSVLDYAMERAGIPSESQEEIVNSDVFREDEILQLVGHIPDQTNELHMLNPNNELRSSGHDVSAFDLFH